MPARFAATRDLLEKELERVNPDTAVKTIDAWEEGLKEVDNKAAKAVLKDLEALKKLLHDPKAKPEKIYQLLGRLGEETTRSAQDAPENQREKLEELGRQLSDAASQGDRDRGRDEERPSAR
jgi:ABC-type amino acid transport substrate-binding protein